MSATPPHTPENAAVEAPQLEEDLAMLLDEQARRLKKKHQRANWVILFLLLGMGGSGGAWYAKSPENRAAVASLIQNIKEGRKDFAMVTDPVAMAAQFDDSLAEINTRNEAINDASRAMGIDPTNMVEDGMDTEMQEMMGGEGRTVGQRNRLLKQKMGVFAEAQVQRAEKKKAAVADRAQPVPAPQATAAQAASVASARPLVAAPLVLGE